MYLLYKRTIQIFQFETRSLFEKIISYVVRSKHSPSLSTALSHSSSNRRFPWRKNAASSNEIRVTINFSTENDGGIINEGRQQRGDRELDRWSGSTIHASCGQHKIGRCDDGSFGLSVDRSWTSGFHEDTLHRAQSWRAYLRLYRIYFKADVRS